MAKGRKPTPTAKLRLTGSRRAGDRPNEPVIDGLPERPAWLTGAAAEQWDKLVPYLSETGIVTPIDAFALARYCAYSVLWLKELNNPGRTEATLERYANQLQRLETNFGLTPSARRGLVIQQPEQPDELDILLRRRFGNSAE